MICTGRFFEGIDYIKFLNFDVMQAQIDIEFDQLVKLVKQLPKKQWTKLKMEVDEKELPSDTQRDMLNLLLNGPTFSQKQLDEISKARKEINQWRAK
jgi:hypothetical protein